MSLGVNRQLFTSALLVSANLVCSVCGLAQAQTTTTDRAHDDTAASSSSAGDAPAPRPPAPRPLAPLPAAPSLALASPGEAERRQLKQWLSAVLSRDASESVSALQQARDASSALVGALRERLDQLADRSDKQAMKQLLQREIQDAKSLRRTTNADDEPEDLEYLAVLKSTPGPHDQAWNDLTEVLAVTTLLEHVGSVEAARQVVHSYVRFGEFLRKEAQRRLQRMGAAGAAALIEATRHKAVKIAEWAQRQLEVTGQDNASDLVQNVDTQGLADLLRAYGRTADPEIARLVLSFANSDKRAVRQAAREATVLLGETAHWQLRDTYANLLGDKPAREWTWDRTARELFTALDRARLADVYRLFEEGQRARQDGQLDQMRASFDQLLILSPLFEEREAIAQGYFAYAQLHGSDASHEARDALQRSLRLTDQQALRERADSLLMTLTADELLTQGIADQVLYRRALHLDPDNAHARERLEEIEQQATLAQARLQRYVGAAVILLATFVMVLYFILTRRQNRRALELSASAEALLPNASERSPSD